MRGKPCPSGRTCRRPRIIPAHAGQTYPLVRVPTSVPDHPRACGANLPLLPARTTPAGSSPRMRGKLQHRGRQPDNRRIIPAHAGQTWPISIRHIKSTDHPRACGANFQPVSQASRHAGSSPRMRGKLTVCDIVEKRARIIPAHAGQTQPPLIIACPATDHPRACGANSPILCENS